VDQIGQNTCVPVDCYEDVLVIAESSASEPDAQQLKHYARSLGNVRVGWRGAGEKTKETLELVKHEQLSPEALAEARAEALKLEKHAYEVSECTARHRLPSSDGRLHRNHVVRRPAEPTCEVANSPPRVRPAMPVLETKRDRQGREPGSHDPVAQKTAGQGGQAPTAPI
jgi:hypothetical protein